MNGETDRTNQASIFTVTVNANKGWILTMRMAIVRLDEFFKAFRKLLKFSLKI